MIVGAEATAAFVLASVFAEAPRATYVLFPTPFPGVARSIQGSRSLDARYSAGGEQAAKIVLARPARRLMTRCPFVAAIPYRM